MQERAPGDILQGSSIAHFVIDESHVVVHWNRACEAMTGYSEKQMLGTKDHWKPFYADERPCLADLLLQKVTEEELLGRYKGMKIRRWELLEGAYEVEGFLAPLGKNGRWLRFTAAPLLDQEGKTIGAIETLEDITERKIAEAEKDKLHRELVLFNKRLQQLALRDPQTGLYNHRYLEEVIEAEVTRAKRYDQPLSLIMIDLDYFKSINDIYGHHFGDLVLKQLSRQLKMIVRRYDIVIRSGGEEFVVICPGTDRLQAIMLAQRMLDAINLYNFGDKKQEVKVKLSLAVTSYPEEKIVDSMDMVEIAEQILNKAKEYGGNRVYSSYDVKKIGSKSRQKSKGKKENIAELQHQLGKVTKNANENLIEAIFAFAKTIETKDHYTGEHVEQTVYYAIEIAKMLKFSKEELQNVHQAAILHDLGKVGISDNILLKEAKLTEEEYAQIKRHPQIAADILRPIRFLHAIIPFILYHHERWDGQGYPSGLKGDVIPMGARIIAVADVYQALTSNRPYRKAFTKEQAVKILKEGSGKQFDPQIVKIFLRVLKGKK